jgi:hypothetical protein
VSDDNPPPARAPPLAVGASLVATSFFFLSGSEEWKLYRKAFVGDGSGGENRCAAYKNAMSYIWECCRQTNQRAGSPQLEKHRAMTACAGADGGL